MKILKRTLADLDFYFDEKLNFHLFPVFVYYKQSGRSSKRCDLKIFFSEEDAVNHFDIQIKDEFGATYLVEKLEIDLEIFLDELNLKSELNKKNLQQEISIEQLNSFELLNPFGLWADDMPHLYDSGYYCYLREEFVM